MAQFRFALWLVYWYHNSKHFSFEWDTGNSTKSKVKHGIEKDDVESVFRLKTAMPFGEQISPEPDELRMSIVGPDFKGRMLSVVFTFRDDKIRAISSRMANKKEKSFYEKIRKTSQDV